MHSLSANARPDDSRYDRLASYKTRSVELRHLHYFVTVADEMSITRAALKLRVSQPSLTRQIRSLEEQLNVPLFYRDNNKLSLTEAGRFFLERTRRLLAQSARDVHDLHRLSLGENGSLNIGYVVDLHYEILPLTLGAFRKVWPDVSLNVFDLSVADQFKALAEDTIDVCFVGEARLPAEAGFQRELIMEGNVLAVLPETHPLAQADTVRLIDLQPLPFITMSETFYPGAREWIHRVCGTAGFTPTIAHEVDRAPTMIGLVALELGVALLPEACMKLPHAGVVFRPLAEQVKSRIEIVWKERNLSRSLLHFIETVRECFAAR